MGRALRKPGTREAMRDLIILQCHDLLFTNIYE